MPLTANALPSTVPSFALPYDSQAAFANAQVITSTGYLNNINSGQIDLGATGSPSSGSISSAGRYVSTWALNITNLALLTNETYQFSLFGSNDVTFGNGNVELLAMHDFATVTAGRFIPTLLGASPVNTPFTQAVPFTNLMQKILYRFLRCRVVIAGGAPTVTVTSWISSSGIDI